MYATVLLQFFSPFWPYYCLVHHPLKQFAAPEAEEFDLQNRFDTTMIKTHLWSMFQTLFMCFYPIWLHLCFDVFDVHSAERIRIRRSTTSHACPVGRPVTDGRVLVLVPVPVLGLALARWCRGWCKETYDSW